MAKENTAADLQKQTRDLLRAQQEAYLSAIKDWRKAVAGQNPSPPWPQVPQFEALPTPAELAEANFAFAAKLLADQSRFMEELSKAMTEEPR